MIRHKSARSANAGHHGSNGVSAGRRILSGFVAALLAGSAGVATAAPAMAAVSQAQQAPAGLVQPANAPGDPGTPSDPTVLFEEDFENTAGTEPVVLDAYEGVDGHTYTAAAPWLSNCNGVIVNFNIPFTTLGNCGSTVSSANLRQ